MLSEIINREERGASNMTFIYVAVFIISLAFALISVFVAKLLLRISRIISTLGQTMNDVEIQVDKTIHELETIIGATETTATDVEAKLLAINGLFSVVKDLGDTTAIVSDDFHTRTKRYTKDGLLSGTKPFIRAIQLGEFGFGLVRSWRKGQNASS